MYLRLSSLVALLLIVGCSNATDTSETPADTTSAAEPTIPFRKDTTLDFVRGGEPFLTIDLEVAANDSARTRGMMQRDAFPNERSGMLFVFPDAQQRSFWMSNTPVPLDIIYVAADSQIVDIHTYAKPFSPAAITSSGPAQYVLEVPAGFADSNGIVESDRLRWSYP